jgi:hypothetical protein
MSMSPVSSSTAIQQSSRVATAEVGEATRGGKEVKSDGDSDDAAASTGPAAAPLPTTNNVGQVIGQHLNVQA